jgi:hypothetical protein
VKLIFTQLVNSLPCMKPKFHFRVHNSPPVVPILSKNNPVRTFRTFFFLKIHSNIIRLSTPRYSDWSVPFGRPKFFIHFSQISHVFCCLGLPKPCWVGPLSPRHGASSGYGWREVLQLRRVAANILNKQSRTADKGWSSR